MAISLVIAVLVAFVAVVAVDALPVNAPVNPVELTDVSPVIVAGKERVTAPVLPEAVI